MKKLLLHCFLLVTAITFALCTHGQTPTTMKTQKNVENQFQTWFGYMTSSNISRNQKWAWWNDAHWVTNGGFFIVRTGLTYNLPKTAITAGYAYARLPESSTNKDLNKQEHRPWAQVVFNLPISGDYSLTQRIRYDARFKEKYVGGKLVDEYEFTNRIRFSTNLRKNLPKWEFKGNTPFIALTDEVLFNFGKNVVSNTFDQNRLSLSFGLKRKNIQYQIGYMNRFVQGAVKNDMTNFTTTYNYTQNHTLMIWVTQKFDFCKKKKAAKETAFEMMNGGMDE